MRKNNLSVILILCFSLLVFGCNKESNYIIEPEELKANTYAWKLDQYNDSATFNLLGTKGWMLVTENHAGELKFMEVVLDGVPLIFLFDTGCYTSQIGPLGLRKIGLDPDTVYSKTNYIIAKKAIVGGVECENIELVLSEDYGYEEYGGCDGFIGMSLFHQSKMIGISYDENMVYANPQVPSTVEFFPVATPTAKDIRFTVYVNIDDSDEKYIGAIDSGAPTITLDNRTFAFNPDYASNDKIWTGYAGVVGFEGKQLSSIKVNNLVLMQPKVRLEDCIDVFLGEEKIDVLIGGPDFWRGRTVYLDIKNRKVGW